MPSYFIAQNSQLWLRHGHFLLLHGHFLLQHGHCLVQLGNFWPTSTVTLFGPNFAILSPSSALFWTLYDPILAIFYSNKAIIDPNLAIFDPNLDILDPNLAIV